MDRKPSISVTRLSEEDRRIMKLETLDNLLPLTFPTSNFTLTEISGQCLKCGSIIDAENLFVERSTHFDGRLMTFDARGYCKDCHLIIRLYFTVNEKGIIRWKDGATYRESNVDIVETPSYKNRPGSILKKILDALF